MSARDVIKFEVTTRERPEQGVERLKGLGHQWARTKIKETVHLVTPQLFKQGGPSPEESQGTQGRPLDGAALVTVSSENPWDVM